MNLFRSKKKNLKQEISDAALLDDFRASGDMQVLAEVYSRYSHLLMGVGLKYLKSEPDAQDAVMEVFESLAEKVRKFEIRDFSSWIYQVMRNHCLLQIRKNKAKLDAQKIWKQDMESEDFLHPEENEYVSYANDQLFYLIDELSNEQQTCIKLFYLEQKCYQEVAEITGYSLKNVKSYLQNGKRNLQIKLKGKAG